MKRILAACLFMAGAPAAAKADPMEGFQSASMGHVSQMVSANPMGLLALLWTSFPGMLLSGQGEPELIAHVHEIDGVLIGDLQMVGFAGGAVDGEWVRVRFEEMGGRWGVAQAGRKVRCANGEATGEWVAGRCPE